MRKIGIIAVLALLVTALAAVPAFAQITRTFNPAGAPTGTHVLRGDPTCSVNAQGPITCTQYTLAGVGNANAVGSLVANYTATVDCRNHGGNVVESHSQTRTAGATTGNLAPENGRLVVTSLSSTRPTNAQFLAQATCPNPNWTPEIRAGTIALSSFTYTLHFVGFPGNFITITGP
jgi:hypothetical protein